MTRRKVYGLVRYAGSHGITGWELCERLGMLDRQSTARTRLTELASEKHGALIVRTDRKRTNGRGNDERVYVARGFEGAE